MRLWNQQSRSSECGQKRTYVLYWSPDAGRACPPWPDSPDAVRIGVRTRGGGRMRFSEFLKYLIVLVLVMALFVAVAR